MPRFQNALPLVSSRRLLTALCLGISTLLGGTLAMAMPAQVVIVRHGEKISDADSDLSPRGEQRAEALVQFTLTNPEISKFGPPVAVFAARPKVDHSQRAVETARPLAAQLGLTVNVDYSKTQTSEIADFVMSNPAFEGRTVFIAWIHGQIPDLATAFGVAEAPKWPGSVFDRAWVIRFDSGAATLNDLPQHLLPGDSAN